MNLNYVVSQIVGFFAFILSLFAYHQKKKKKNISNNDSCKCIRYNSLYIISCI